MKNSNHGNWRKDSQNKMGSESLAGYEKVVAISLHKELNNRYLFKDTFARQWDLIEMYSVDNTEADRRYRRKKMQMSEESGRNPSSMFDSFAFLYVSNEKTKLEIARKGLSVDHTRPSVKSCRLGKPHMGCYVSCYSDIETQRAQLDGQGDKRYLHFSVCDRKSQVF